MQSILKHAFQNLCINIELNTVEYSNIFVESYIQQLLIKLSGSTGKYLKLVQVNRILFDQRLK